MKVETILKAKGNRIVTVRPDAGMAQILEELKRHGIGAVVVSEDDRKVLGIVSERDIVRRLLIHGIDLLDMTARDLMTQPVHTCTPGDNLRYVMREMTQRRIRHMPVVDQGRLSGMVSIGDVLKNRLEELEMEADILRKVHVAGG